MDIESQQEGVHALPSTRDYGWDHDDMPNLGLDTPYSLPMSAPMQRPVTSFLMAQQTFQYPGPVNSTSPILNNCRPLACRADNVLPSEEIDCSCLQDPDVVIQRYPNLKRESNAGELTTKLAREAYFVMMKCTVGGAGNLPAFLAQEMKRTTYWQNPADFEVLWTKCTKAACRGLRRAQQLLANFDQFCISLTSTSAPSQMKGTKVLTLGAGREVLPHNMADDIYTRPLAIRMRYMCIYACTVLLIGGRACLLPTRGLLPAC